MEVYFLVVFLALGGSTLAGSVKISGQASFG